MKERLIKKQLVKERRRLADNLKRRRKKAGYSQVALAKAARTHRTYISLIERCATNPSLALLGRLAAALHIKTVDLLR